MALRVAIDIGGGFVDLVAIDEQTGELVWSKVRTTPHDLNRCVKDVFDSGHVDARAVCQLLHGHTLVIYAIAGPSRLYGAIYASRWMSARSPMARSSAVDAKSLLSTYRRLLQENVE